MNRVELIKTLEVVSRGLSNNNIAPAFSYFCFTGETVFSWNDSIAIVGPCKVEKPFGCHGATLLGLLKNCKTPGVEFEVQKDCLLIIAGNSEFKLPYLTQDEFLWKEPDLKGNISYEYSYIAEGMNTCLATSSNDVALGVFNQICLGSNKDQLVIYSCDGDAITKVTTDVQIGPEDASCISRATCEAIHRTWDMQEPWIGNEFLQTKEWVCALVGESLKIYGRNLGPPQLDYEAEIRKSVGVNNFKFVPIPPELNDALSRARVVADAETKPTQLIVTTEDRGSHASEMFLVTSTQQGHVQDSFKCEHSLITVNISAAMLQKSLEGCTKFCVTENCILLKGERILRLLANLG